MKILVGLIVYLILMIGSWLFVYNSTQKQKIINKREDFNMSKDNFKVIAKDDHSPIWSKGKIYNAI